MGLGGGGEFKKECKKIAPSACRTVQIDDAVREEMALDAVIVDFEATFFPIISGARNVSEIRSSAQHFLNNVSDTYGCSGEIHLLFEGARVPVIKQMLWSKRTKKALSPETVEQHRERLEGLLDMDDVAAVSFAGEIVGDALKEDRNAVTELMSQLMSTREFRTRIRRDWVTTLQESAYRRSPFKLVELLDAPFTQLAPPAMFATGFGEGAGASTKKRKVVDDVVPHKDIKLHDYCYITWDESGTKQRSVVRVPDDRTGEGEAKIPQVVLRCFREGKQNVLVKSRDSDALVYLLLMMRDLINEDGVVGLNVYLDMGPPNFTEPGTLLINVSELYTKLVLHLANKWPHVVNPVEMWLTSFVMAGCDYLESPRGWGIRRFVSAFEGVGHVILAQAISCSRRVSEPNGFIRLDEERFIKFMQIMAATDWARVMRALDEDAARGKQDVQDELNSTNFRLMPSASTGAKKENPEIALGRAMVRLVADFEDAEQDLSGSQKGSTASKAAFDRLVSEIFDMCPSWENILSAAVKRRNASKAKTEERKPAIPWNFTETKAFVRRLTYVMMYFRHSPYGWNEDPLEKDEGGVYSKWGWERAPITNEIRCASFVL